jgi:Gpi18-like mannosyltransferase
MIAAAILIKPPVLVLVPLFVLYPFTLDVAQRRRRLIETAFGIAGSLALTELLAYVFFAHPTPLTAMRHLVSQIYYGSGYYPFTTLNAFNLWALFGPFFVPDTARVFLLSTHLWGTLLFCGMAALIYWGFLRSRDRDALFAASTLILLAFFLCLTEMHERYLIYCVMFMPALAFRKPYRSAALVLSLTLLLNLEYGLTFMYLDDAKATMIDRFAFAPWLVHLCSLANIGVFGWLLARYLGFDPPTRGHDPSALSSEHLRRTATVTPLRKPVNR